MEAVVTRNYYSEINLHVFWHTKNSTPLLTPAVEPLVHRYLKQKLINADGLFVHEIGGTETHVYVVVTVLPTIRPSERPERITATDA
jgi:REP element-mobilizing transposase RayT